ncbi:MAG: DUF4071 domain-containing protein [Hyphomicrobiales bacterium]|nr:DUF4071 domain-containing protein [Hyphomicrobiales bacterium]
MAEPEKLTCFVVMGFGTKTDPNSHQTFDLDKSYKYIIKPAVEAAGFRCERADEIEHAGVIDLPMYQRLMSADLVIADLSTCNVNAFFELGVRYALKPRATIVIAESGFKNPFDTNHVVVRTYDHMGTGIDYEEVERFRGLLTNTIQALEADKKVDSPVYTFLDNLVPPSIAESLGPATKSAMNGRTHDAIAGAKTEEEAEALKKPLAVMVEKAMEAKAQQNFLAMQSILSGVVAAQGDAPDVYLTQQLALATYKAEMPTKEAALLKAHEILNTLHPLTTTDPETLGLWGAVHKRLWELDDRPMADRRAALDNAIWAHEKGFHIKYDYYNGINYAFLLDVRAAHEEGNEATADRVQAERVRRRVIKICEGLVSQPIGGETEMARKEQEYWIYATLAEAYCGIGDIKTCYAWLEKASAVGADEWMIDTTKRQLKKLEQLRG